jgi:hypothetical protein
MLLPEKEAKDLRTYIEKNSSKKEVQTEVTEVAVDMYT